MRVLDWSRSAKGTPFSHFLSRSILAMNAHLFSKVVSIGFGDNYRSYVAEFAFDFKCVQSVGSR